MTNETDERSGEPIGMPVVHVDKRWLIALLLALVAAIGGWRWYYLLYTSDAGGQRSSVDPGGRRIIKKKNYINLWRPSVPHCHHLFLLTMCTTPHAFVASCAARARPPE